MTDESNQDALATLRQMVILAQQLALLNLLKNLLNFYRKGDIAPMIIRLIEYEKARFNDPSFRHTLELVTASLTKVTEREDKELSSTMPTEQSNRYTALIDDLNRELARLDEEISQH